MRPNLKVARLTQEDAEIWGWSVHRKARWGFWRGLFERSRKQDRRDAALMLLAKEVSHFGDAAIQLYGIDFRGWSNGSVDELKIVK